MSKVVMHINALIVGSLIGIASGIYITDPLIRRNAGTTKRKYEDQLKELVDLDKGNTDEAKELRKNILRLDKVASADSIWSLWWNERFPRIEIDRQQKVENINSNKTTSE